MKRKRTLLILALAILAAPLRLAAAGGEEAAAETGPIKMSFWHLWGGSRAELMDDLAKKFKASHQNVELDVTFTPPNDLQTKVVQAAGTGTLPDVFEMHSGWYDNLQPADTMLKLDPFLAAEKIDIKAILLEPEWKRSYYDNAVYSLPNVLAGAQGLLFYNKGLMRKAGLDAEKDAPKNWDEFLRVSKVLIKALNQPGKLDVIVWDPWMHVGQNMIQVYSHMAGSPTVSADGRTSLFNTPGVLDTARKFDQYITEVYGPYGGYKALIEWSSRVAGVDYGAAQVQAFIKEAQVFYVSGSWTIGQVQAGNPKLDMGLLPIPRIQGTARRGGQARLVLRHQQEDEGSPDRLGAHQVPHPRPQGQRRVLHSPGPTLPRDRGQRRPALPQPGRDLEEPGRSDEARLHPRVQRPLQRADPLAARRAGAACGGPVDRRSDRLRPQDVQRLPERPVPEIAEEEGRSRGGRPAGRPSAAPGGCRA